VGCWWLPPVIPARDQEDRGPKPAEQIVHETLSQKNPTQKSVGGVAQGVDPEFKPQHSKNPPKKPVLRSLNEIVRIDRCHFTLRLSSACRCACACVRAHACACVSRSTGARLSLLRPQRVVCDSVSSCVSSPF
jgi:hypothetical protein